MSEARGANRQAQPRPLPFPSAVSEPFWAACRRRELTGQHCPSCGNVQLYPRGSCTACGSVELGWRTLSGRGTVHTFTVARRPTHPKLADRVPYVIAVIELDEGPRITSTVVDLDPDELRIGQPVTVDFEDQSAEGHEPISVPVFRVVP